jgi:hypothetical protein
MVSHCAPFVTVLLQGLHCGNGLHRLSMATLLFKKPELRLHHGQVGQTSLV